MGRPCESLNPVYGFAGSCVSSVGRVCPGARNVTVWTTRLLKIHFTESPTWIVTVRRKNPLRSSAAGNVTDPAWDAFGGGPPVTTTLVFALAAGAAQAAATVAITSAITHRLTGILLPLLRGGMLARR